MVAPALIGAGIQAIGGIFGGRARKKAAKREAARLEALQREVSSTADAGIRTLDQDQARAISYRADDEQRLREATGFDFVKLVGDAEKAGFNPLTVLNATGGAGYDGRGAVMTTPFIGKADGFFQKAGLLSGGMGAIGNAGQAVVQSSGYFGDAISGLGGSIFQLGRDQTQRRHEGMMQEAFLRGGTSATGAAGGKVSGGRAGGSAPMVGASRVTASPLANTGFMYRGGMWDFDPRTSDAAVLTQRYGEGELVDTVGGLSVLWADVYDKSILQATNQWLSRGSAKIDVLGPIWVDSAKSGIANAWANRPRPGAAGDGWSASGAM